MQPDGCPTVGSSTIPALPRVSPGEAQGWQMDMVSKEYSILSQLSTTQEGLEKASMQAEQE